MDSRNNSINWFGATGQNICLFLPTANLPTIVNSCYVKNGTRMESPTIRSQIYRSSRRKFNRQTNKGPPQRTPLTENNDVPDTLSLNSNTDRVKVRVAKYDWENFEKQNENQTKLGIINDQQTQQLVKLSHNYNTLDSRQNKIEKDFQEVQKQYKAIMLEKQLFKHSIETLQTKIEKEANEKIKLSTDITGLLKTTDSLKMIISNLSSLEEIDHWEILEIRKLLKELITNKQMTQDVIDIIKNKFCSSPLDSNKNINPLNREKESVKTISVIANVNTTHSKTNSDTEFNNTLPVTQLPNFRKALTIFSDLTVNNISIVNEEGTLVENLTETQSQPTQSNEDLPFSELLREVLSKKSILTTEEKYLMEHFLIEHEEFFSTIPGCSDLEQHSIDTGNNLPVRRNRYPETPEKQKIIKDEVDKMLQCGFISHSRSPWSAPVTLVKKPDGSVRFCVDYRGLNEVTTSDEFPMPNMDGIIQQLHGSKYLSSLDMVQGFYQCRVAEQDRPKTAFTCGAGLFQFNVMPFGLKNAPATFNRLMSRVLETVKGKTTLFYLDDIVVFSTTFDQHLLDLHQVLDLLRKENLYVKLKKCQFCQEAFKFLGHIIRNGEIHIDPEKIESIKSFIRPRTVKEVQRFLGLTGWLRKHVPDYASISSPLTKLTGGKNPKKTFKWTDDCQVAFQTLKKILTKDSIALTLPDFGRHFFIESDCSDHGLGGILAQRDDEGRLRIIEYASRQLHVNEVKFSVSEKECLAIVWLVCKFRGYIADRPFTVITDHNALKWLLKTKDLSSRLTRWSLRLQEFDFNVQYRKGTDNGIADALSRGTGIVIPQMDDLEIERLSPPMNAYAVNLVKMDLNLSDLDINDLIEEQKQDEQLVRMMEKIKATNMKNGTKNYKNYHLVNDVLYYKTPSRSGTLVIVVPESRTQSILKFLHTDPCGGHFGIEKTIRKLQERAFWRNMAHDVKNYIKQCHTCQMCKHPNKILRGPMVTNFVHRPMEMWGMDLMGPYVRSNRQNIYLLVVVDHYSKWVEIFPLKQSKTELIAGHLSELFSRFGKPDKLLSDNGPQFVSKIYDNLCAIWDIKPIKTTIYHPRTNFVEASNKTIKRLLRCYISDNQKTWDRYLHLFLMALRSTVNKTTGYTPSMLFIGREINLPIDSHLKTVTADKAVTPDEYVLENRATMTEIHKEVKINMEKYKSIQKVNFDKHSNARVFQAGDIVKIKNHVQSSKIDGITASLAPVWKGPYKIIRAFGNGVYEILNMNDDKDSCTINVERMDAYYTDDYDRDDTPDTPEQNAGALDIPHTHGYHTRSKANAQNNT